MIPQLWVVVALVKVAFHIAFQIGKKVLSTEYDPLHVAFAATVIGVSLYIPVVALAGSGESIIVAVQDPGLVVLMTVSGFLNAGVFYTSLRAMQTEDVSLVTPLTQTYPVLVALMEPLLVGDIRYSPILLVAAVLAGLGGYGTMLEDTGDALEPLRRVRSRGIQFAFGVAALSAGVAIVDRTALLRSGLPPYIYPLPAGVFLITAILVLLFATNRGLPTVRVFTDWRIQATGCAIAGMTLFTFATFQLVTATQATIAFLLVAPGTVLVGGNLLEEGGLLRKAVSATLILVAVGLATVV